MTKKSSESFRPEGLTRMKSEDINNRKWIEKERRLEPRRPSFVK